MFLAFLLSAVVQAAVVTESVGQVGDYVITSREVQISTVIENVLFQGKQASGIQELSIGSSGYRAAVANILLEVVVAKEAENFSVGTLSSDELNSAMQTVEKAVAGKAYWKNLGVSSSELQNFTSRKLIAKNFLKFKSNSMVGIITDQEAQAYYDKNRLKFGSMPFSSFKENIKTFLSQQQLEERLRSWFEIIKRKYKVRNLLPTE